MNRKMIGSANGASADARVGDLRSTTASTGPRMAVAAIGSASLTQSTTTMPRMAAMRCAGVASGSGASQSASQHQRAEPQADGPAAAVELFLGRGVDLGRRHRLVKGLH